METIFAKAQLPIPIFNTSDFQDVLGSGSGSLSLDHQGLFRPLEMIAFPGMIFELRGEGEDFYEVFFPDYCKKRTYFVCKIGVELISSQPHVWKRKKFTPSEIEQRLISQMGRPYLWGGNLSEPIKYMLDLYPQLVEIGGFDGIDCSGLIYWASCGATPRNVSGLKEFGVEIACDDWTPQPLDMILLVDDPVLDDHIVYVLSNGNVIESKEKFGVYQTPLENRLRGLDASKRRFVIRRGNFA